MEDRISDLPDSIIHHILSFLPSTKQAIQTSVMSKRWQKQWTYVPVLIFNYSGTYSDVSDEGITNISRSIDNILILHDCSKIKIFHLDYPCRNEKDPHFSEKIRFATRKDVEELYLNTWYGEYVLPKFLLNNVSVVKLNIICCKVLMSNEKVNWECLTELNMEHCNLPDQVIGHMLSGSPLLFSLELCDCDGFDKFVIASKSMKRLVFRYKDFDRYSISHLEISCQNLEVLYLEAIVIYDPNLFAQAIENVLSVSLLLESFELIDCLDIDKLVIASKSLKRLVLRDIYVTPNIEISCPTLEELKLLGNLNVRTAKLMSLTSSLSATIDYYCYDCQCYYDVELCYCESLFRDILLILQHVEELRIGRRFFQFLSALELVEVLFSPMLNIKCLILNSVDFLNEGSRIACTS
ncbi:F-box/LRR-repeat protein 25-like [Euphorbia lathyris]|uniref:F-box/LRR-repeat protein 25-like n=1 Tax=Euphorbia lathyris TaxID=212925 RepID=UPI003313A1D7